VTRESLDAAAAAGLEVIGSGGPDSYRALDAHPALRAWYLYDEPDMHRVSPAKVAAMNRELHRFARKPSFLVLMSGAAVEKYQESGDLIAVDWYPVPWAPVATVAREMRLARLGLDGRPFFAILQAFDWSSFPELLRADGPLRPPTRDETRCMAYLALMQGASGLFFYAYETDRWKLREHPPVWENITAVAAEILADAPIFSGRVKWWPVRDETHGPAADMHNEIMEPRVLLGLFEVKKPQAGVAAGYYVAAANTSALPADFSFTLPFTQINHLETSRAGEPFVLQGRTIRKSYAPFEVAIFGPISGQLED
jgi:hypothetical protein